MKVKMHDFVKSQNASSNCEKCACSVWVILNFNNTISGKIMKKSVFLQGFWTNRCQDISLSCLHISKAIFQEMMQLGSNFIHVVKVVLRMGWKIKWVQDNIVFRSVSKDLSHLYLKNIEAYWYWLWSYKLSNCNITMSFDVLDVLQFENYVKCIKMSWSTLFMESCNYNLDNWSMILSKAEFQISHSYHTVKTCVPIHAFEISDTYINDNISEILCTGVHQKNNACISNMNERFVEMSDIWENDVCITCHCFDLHS